MPRSEHSTAATIKQAAVRVTALMHDDAAWERAEALTADVDRWIWAAPGSQLGRLSTAHRVLDPDANAPVLLEHSPSSPQDEEQYGLGASGDVLVHREWLHGVASRRYAYLRSGATTLIFRWDDDGSRGGIELISERSDGRLSHTVDVNEQGECFAERYDWAAGGGALVAVELLAVSSSERLQARRVRVTDRFEYVGGAGA